jgi:hypothetical protein
MKHWTILPLLMLASTLLVQSGCVVAAPGPPPPPVVEAYGPAPYPGAVWVSGAWAFHHPERRWAWHRGHWR